jgi:hypothetical protein
MSALPPSPDRRREWLATWFDYYSEKRIGQQWLQVHLLKDLPVRRVLEIGPYLGLVTAMLDNAGFEVTTLDLVARAFDRPDVPHIEADLTAIDPTRLTGFDLVLCCETLEHLSWEAAAQVLRTLRRSGAGWLITSVPYEGLQLDFWLYANPFRLRRRLALKKGRGSRRFTPDADPYGHKWECGYRGTRLADWERQLGDAGWQIRRREFTSPCRSVFHLSANLEAGG